MTKLQLSVAILLMSSVICFSRFPGSSFSADGIGLSDKASGNEKKIVYNDSANRVRKENSIQYNEKELQSLLEYPSEARRKRIEGYVIIRAMVDEEGKAETTVVEFSSNEIFNDAATEAVEELEFTLKGGPDNISVTVQFKMETPWYEDGELFFLGEKLGLKEMHSGIQYFDEYEGIGLAAAPGHEVELEIKAYDEAGAELFSTKQEGAPMEFEIGQTLFVMKGLEEGIIGMKKEGRRILLIPPEMQEGIKPKISIKGQDYMILDIVMLDVK